MQKIIMLPSRRKSGSATYEWQIDIPNAMQVRSAVKPFEKRLKNTRKPFPWWVAALALLTVVVAITGILITVFE